MKKTIQEKFNEIADKKPYWSSFVIFAQALKGRNYGIIDIVKAFDILVDKKDYLRSERLELLEFLRTL